MELFKKLKEINSKCESFSSRNMLEVLALQKGVKNVVRIPIKSHEWDILKQFCNDNDFSICHSNFKISVKRKTTLGDVFTENVSWDSNSENIVGFVAYIATSMGIAKKASNLESSADSFVLGELYQYPNCCVKAYSDHIEEEGFWLDFLLKKTIGFSHSLYSNKLAYLIDETSIIPDYFPCSLNCKETIKLGKIYKNILLECQLEDYYKDLKKNLKKPIVVGDGILFQFAENLPYFNIQECNKFIWKNKKKHFTPKKGDVVVIDYENNIAKIENKILGNLFQFEDK